jgi:glycine/D-amino acid oxidase-like deaminating enzyme/nitrite reductase/ring-hydroxylating ferredoxin subunit
MKQETSSSHTFPRDGKLLSPWQTEANSKDDTSRKNQIQECDVLIAGAGITGLTAALKLRQAGKKVIVADLNSPGFGTTGGTSAHINTFADTTYTEVRQSFGADAAKQFAKAVLDGFQIISDNIKQLNISCDFEDKPGYLYAETEEEEKQLDDIYKGALDVGVEMSYTEDAPLKPAYLKALLIPNQAQFHPLKYLQALAKEFTEIGGIILEDTKIESLNSTDGRHECKFKNGSVTASHVFYATHVPPGLNLFNFRCAPYRSYVMAFKLKSGQYPDALIYDMQEPYHYIRTHEVDGEQLLLVGGEDHKTGHDDPEKAFKALEKYTSKYYNISSVKYKWSSQYYIPVDGLPYVGQMPLAAKGIYCATGYNGNGMMLGSISGSIVADLILDKKNELSDLFNPSRLKPIEGFTEFVKENADAAYHFVADRLSIKDTDSLNRLRPGTGKVVELDGKKVAAYRDDQGEFHTLSPVCTHAKCIVNWNAEETTWDCPCHGARYDIEGQVLNGPATKNLEKIDFSKD